MIDALIICALVVLVALIGLEAHRLRQYRLLDEELRHMIDGEPLDMPHVEFFRHED